MAKPGFRLLPNSPAEAALDARFQSPAVYRFRMPLPALGEDASPTLFTVVERREDAERSPLLAWGKEEAIKYQRNGLLSEGDLAELETVRGRVSKIDAAKASLDAVKRHITGLDVTSSRVDVDAIARLVEVLERSAMAFDSDDGGH